MSDKEQLPAYIGSPDSYGHDLEHLGIVYIPHIAVCGKKYCNCGVEFPYAVVAHSFPSPDQEDGSIYALYRAKTVVVALDRAIHFNAEYKLELSILMSDGCRALYLMEFPVLLPEKSGNRLHFDKWDEFYENS